MDGNGSFRKMVTSCNSCNSRDEALSIFSLAFRPPHFQGFMKIRSTPTTCTSGPPGSPQASDFNSNHLQHGYLPSDEVDLADVVHWFMLLIHHIQMLLLRQETRGLPLLLQQPPRKNWNHRQNVPGTRTTGARQDEILTLTASKNKCCNFILSLFP